MGRHRSEAETRQRLRLLLVVVAVALSLLAMHQLSINHTAADPTPASVAAGSAPGAMNAAAPHLHGQDHSVDADESGHAHLEPAVGTGQPAPEAGGCPECGQHVMALTCVAALVLFAIGWALTRPASWRGVRLRRLLLLVVRLTSTRLPVPRSLAELSVSRT